MIRSLMLVGLLALANPVMAQEALEADAFVQGPEAKGQVRALAGTVIGTHVDLERNCYILLADRPEEGWEGLGGGGRFFLCRPKGQALEMGEYWTGTGVQEGTRLHRMGPRRRVLPLFTPTDRR